MRKFNVGVSCRNNFFIIIVFAILSFFSGFILVHSNFVSYAWDLYFHWQRILEMKYNILNGSIISPVALNKFAQSGTAVMTMYPKANLFPIVILSFLIHSFARLAYIAFILRNFTGLVIAYFSCYHFSKDKKVSFIFSISYILTSMSLFYEFVMMDMGVSSSIILLPLVLFGTFELIQNNGWMELTIGLSLILLCHVLTAIISLILVFILLIINTNNLNRRRIILRTVKSMSIFALISSVFWIPFLYLYVGNNISMPQPPNTLFGDSIHSVISTILHNRVDPKITIAAIFGIILSIFRYNYLNKYKKQLLIISIVSLFICSNFFPWGLLGHTFVVNTFQYPWRLYIVPQLLLTYLFASTFVEICRNKKVWVAFILVFTFFLMFSQMFSQTKVLGEKHIYNMNKVNTIVNESNYYYTDYFPKNSLSLKKDIVKHQITYNKDRKLTADLLGNGRFSFKLVNSSESVKLPFLIYKNINYQVKVDGKNAKFHADKHAQLTLGSMSRGKHTVQVIVHRSWYSYLSYVLSAIGILIVLAAWIKSLVLKLKNE